MFSSGGPSVRFLTRYDGEVRDRKNDVFRLTELLDQNQQPFNNLPKAVRDDMRTFFERMVAEEVDLKQLGIREKTKESILDQLRGIYC